MASTALLLVALLVVGIRHLVDDFKSQHNIMVAREYYPAQPYHDDIQRFQNQQYRHHWRLTSFRPKRAKPFILGKPRWETARRVKQGSSEFELKAATDDQ